MLHDNGTSVAAPQVAGLASYLWILSPDLRGLPSSITKRTILSNTRNNKLIDAYATVLALDGTTLTPATAPMRFALLNVHRDDKFDEQDLDEFLTNLFVSTAGDISHTPSPATTADFSKFDLNGDGFTTAADRRERFDLDRVGSTQFGASNYSSDVHETIEGQDIHFDETSLTDIQILCYYAYSPLYTGDTDARKNLMAGRCGISVLPATATIRAQQQQQFTVSLPNNDTVAWTITGAGNSITSTGLVTAGTTPGTYTVTATDINSANLSGTATLIVTAGGPDCSALAGINKGLEVSLGDHTTSDEKQSDTLLTLSDDLNTADSHLSATAAYGSGEVSVTDNNTGRDIPGGSGVFAEASETILIIPNDPSLNGTPLVATGSLKITASASVTGDRAATGWGIDVEIGNDISPSFGALISTIDGQSRGNISGGTFTVTGNGTFGQNFTMQPFFSASATYPCKQGEQCPPRSAAGTGTANVSASFQWLGITSVKDQNGNSVGFTECSLSGFTY